MIYSVETPARGSTIHVRDDRWDEWFSETPADVSIEGPAFEALVIPGRYDQAGEYGATLWWRNSHGDWAEHYSDSATALARLAVLIRAQQTGKLFADSAHGFVRWSDHLFNQSLTDGYQVLTD